MTETFTFAQLNFSEDQNQRQRRERERERLRERGKISPASAHTSRSTSPSPHIPQTFPTHSFNPSTTTTPSPSRYTNTEVRSSSMSLFVPPKLISHPSFDPEKYVRTQRGYINKSIFSVNRTTPDSFTNACYITEFPYSIIRDALNVISESDSVLKFVLEHLKQLPCNVPIRWGVLFNLKFRRIFQCLDVGKWINLSKILERHGYAKIERLNVFLLNPQVTEYADFFNDLSDEPQTPIKEILVPRTPPMESSAPFTPIRSSTPTEIPIDSPGVIPVPRAHNDSIYAISYRNSSDPNLAPRFRPHSFESSLRIAIFNLFHHNNELIENVFKQLAQLPVSIPLRWGCIYNKHLRVRRRRQTNCLDDSVISLTQWKEVKNLLKEYGYLDDKIVINCSILNNK